VAESLPEIEKLLERVKEDLRFCEESLRREARIELVIKILEEVLNHAEELILEGLPERERTEAKAIAARARLLYHRAVALNALKEDEAARG